jgi:hypothetical protein
MGNEECFLGIVVKNEGAGGVSEGRATWSIMLCLFAINALFNRYCDKTVLYCELNANVDTNTALIYTDCSEKTRSQGQGRTLVQ